MKKQFLSFLSLCVLLLGCSQQPDVSFATTAPNSPTSTAPPTPTVFTYPDWSEYMNDKNFETILADINELGNGYPVIVTSETHKVKEQTKVNSLAEAGELFYDGLCDKDLSHLDLRYSSGELQRIHYDSYTVWPNLLPEGFDPAALLERSKNPGLGVRTLHDRGYTGKGVSIGIIDASLLVEHEEYKDNIMLYEKLHAGESYAVLHGTAVTSIAVGKDVGVAPDANVYYIASQFGAFVDGAFQYDAKIVADCILRLLEVNRQLPDEEKISVISVSIGTEPDAKGYDAYVNALETAKSEGVLVITVDSLELLYDFDFTGLELNTTGDPDDASSYRPPHKSFYIKPALFDSIVLVPMAGRTIAGERGTDYYQYDNSRWGMSWAVPWMAGFYSLCKQANPELTPDAFLEAITVTAVSSTFKHEGKQYTLLKIINPEATLDLLVK